MKSSKRIVNPKKLLNSKWTAILPTNNEKHFLVTKLVKPENTDQSIELVELEAIHTKRTQRLPWQVFNNASIWLQGWV